MAITDIQATVLRITGVTPTANSVEDAQRFAVSSIPKVLLKWAASETVSGTHGGDDSPTAVTLPVGTDSIIAVRRDSYDAKEVTLEDRAWLESSSGSLKVPTASFPKYYIAAGNQVRVKPDPTASKTAHVTYVDYSNIDDDSDLRNAVIFHTSAQEFEKIATGKTVDWSDLTLPSSPSPPSFGNDLSIASAAPSAPSSPSFTYTDASVSDITQSIISISDMASMDVSAPSYVEPSLSLGTTPTISDLSIAAVPPDVPSLATVTFASLDSDIDSSAPTFTTATVSAGGVFGANSAPAYTKPGHPTQVSFEDFFNLTEDGNPFGDSDPGAISISSVPPVSPIINAESSSTGGAEVDTNKLATAPTYTAPAMFPPNFSDADTWVNTEEDPEMVSSRMQVISGQIGEFSAKVQDSLNTFNKENTEYQAKLQIALQDASQANSGDTTLISKFSSELGTYQANVSKEVQEYQQKLARYQLEISIVQQAWSKTESDNISVFQSDIQNELNEFNKENISFQANMQEAMQEIQVANQVNIAQGQANLQVAMDNENRSQQRLLQNGINDMQAIMQNNDNLISKYSAELQQYQAEVAAEVQEYQQNLEGDLQVWQSERQTDIQKYSTDIQNNLNSFNKSNVEYQQDIQRKVQNLQKDIQEVLRRAQNELDTRKSNLDKDVQLGLQNAMNDFRQDVDEYTAKIQLYSANINTYQADINKELQNYLQSLDKKSKEYQSKLALYNADLQKYQAQAGEKTQKVASATQNASYYSLEAKKYYEWAVTEVNMYTQNNSKMINQTMAAQAAAQQRR